MVANLDVPSVVALALSKGNMMGLMLVVAWAGTSVEPKVDQWVSLSVVVKAWMMAHLSVAG